MRACSMASGAVFFIPDQIERKDCTKKSFKDEARYVTPPSFGKRKPMTQPKEGSKKITQKSTDIRSAA